MPPRRRADTDGEGGLMVYNFVDGDDPPWTGTAPRKARSGNNKNKMNALEDAYNKLKSQTPNVSGTRRVTKLDIIRSASLHTASLEEQLREARASRPEMSAIGLTGAQHAPLSQTANVPRTLELRDPQKEQARPAHDSNTLSHANLDCTCKSTR